MLWRRHGGPEVDSREQIMNSTTVIALCALVVSVVSTGLAVWTAFVQRKHMRLSVRPIASVPVADFENRVGVFLQNKGIGPMRVRSLRVANAEGVEHDDLVTHMPPLAPGILWSNFYDSVDGSALEAGKRFLLLLLEGDPQDPEYRQSRDVVRRRLSSLVVRVEYEDLYGQPMEPLEQKLSWFGRHDA